ncbi:MAG TPA: hypothetical protein QF870_01790, partial [Nitrospinota bacterium]|nr:hypothetical protein [Nitrospinota bacterium]
PRSLLRAGGYEATQTLASRDLLSLCWPLELYSLPKEMSHIYLNLYTDLGGLEGKNPLVVRFGGFESLS